MRKNIYNTKKYHIILLCFCFCDLCKFVENHVILVQWEENWRFLVVLSIWFKQFLFSDTCHMHYHNPE